MDFVMRMPFLVAGFALASVACSSDPASSDPAPGGPRGLATLKDLNPDPSIVEVQIVAAPSRVELLSGKPADVWAFRDASDSDAPASVPGPLLDIEVGQRVVAHVRNELAEETTVHWHGLKVPNASDGTHASQMPIAPGGTFDYEFTASESGLFWYHPHLRADVQIERGLYAPIIVRGGPELPVAADRVFVLDDVKVEFDGRLAEATTSLDIMLGRQGNVLLVNGEQRPRFDVKAGSRERWRFVNAANGRFFRLALAGHEFRVIGSDGGPLTEPYLTESVLITPGERHDILVDLDGEPGQTLALETLHYDRGHEIPDPGPIAVLELHFADRTEEQLPELPSTWGNIERIETTAATPSRSLTLTEQEVGAPEPRFFINGEAFPNVTPATATLADVEIWEILNETEMDHPFHLHGTFFQLLDVDGLAAERLAWKDTINVPRGSLLRFAVRHDNPGRWMFHCHILEHAERGMMGELVVAAARN